MSTQNTSKEWWQEEFGRAELGNALRTRRLVRLGEGAEEHPGSLLSEVYKVRAERKAAYRFVESDAIDTEPINRCRAKATAQRATRECSSRLLISIDQTETLHRDPDQLRELGSSSTAPYSETLKAIQWMNALGLNEEGKALGLAGQKFWLREPPEHDEEMSAEEREKEKRKSRSERSIEDKENRFWLEIAKQVMDNLEGELGELRPCLIGDRAMDFKEMHQWVEENRHRADVTMRAQADRSLNSHDENLYATLSESQKLGTYRLELPRREVRKRTTGELKKVLHARCASIEVRAVRVKLWLNNYYRGKDLGEAEYWAVEALEANNPKGEEPIHWRLLTTLPVRNAKEACEVIDIYTKRWKVEELHRCWKNTYEVESMQLEEASNMFIWATILASAAVRTEHLKQAARKTPEAPAVDFLSPEEVKAISTLHYDDPDALGEDTTIRQAVILIARFGGHMGNPDKRPPGAVVISRGLEYIQPLARALQTNELKAKT